MTVSETLIQQVRNICNISDARHAGLYSVCGLALRLRDLFKWEKELFPWQERDAKQVLDWIDAKEKVWETLEDQDYGMIFIEGEDFDPFDTKKINAVLEPFNLFYGAGYAYSLKPTFFLAPILTRQEISGITVFTLGHELARDLLTLPALTQDNDIVLRTEAAKLYLWDQITYIKRSSRPALNMALSAMGITSTDATLIKAHFEDIFQILRKNYIRHELGEIKEKTFDRRIWRELIAKFAHTPIELLARAIKDLLADTHTIGPLTRIVTKRDAVALGFYAAFLDGLGKQVFFRFIRAFGDFLQNANWSIVEQSVVQGREKAAAIARDMSAIFLEGQHRHDPKWTAAKIDRSILAPLLKNNSNI